MLDETQMKLVLQQYIDGFNRKDSDLLISLFADDAKIEDPVGGGKIVKGKDSIASFYKQAVTMVDKLELAAPIRGSHSNFAAMAFDIFIKMGDKNICIYTIDVMEFNNFGKIVDMKAFHGPEDMVELQHK